MTNKTEMLDGSELERIRGLMADVVDKSSKRKDACVYRGEPSVLRHSVVRLVPGVS